MISFDTLYSQYAQKVRRRISGLVSSEQVDDLCQETWLRAWKALPRLKHEEHLYAWLYLIATNVVRNAMRKQHSNKGATDLSLDAVFDGYETGDLSLIDEGADPAVSVIERLHRDAIWSAAWKRLNVGSRAALIAYAREEPVALTDVYQARRLYKNIRKREQARQERRHTA